MRDAEQKQLPESLEAWIADAKRRDADKWAEWKVTWEIPTWRTLLLLVAVLAAPGCAPRTSAITDPDQEVLDQLVRNHSDMRKPHRIDFYLYFPTKAAGADAAVTLRREGFTVDVSQGAKGSQWLCLVSQTFVPTKERVHSIQARMRAIAAEGHGEYDGWESEIKP